MPPDTSTKVRLDMMIDRDLKQWLQKHVKRADNPYQNVTDLVTHLIVDYHAQQGRINDDEVVEQV